EHRQDSSVFLTTVEVLESDIKCFRAKLSERRSSCNEILQPELTAAEIINVIPPTRTKAKTAVSHEPRKAASKNDFVTTSYFISPPTTSDLIFVQYL
ncbi:hypothetical protein J6590_020951, partial [Homalodisca vitripennis]